MFPEVVQHNAVQCLCCRETAPEWLLDDDARKWTGIGVGGFRREPASREMLDGRLEHARRNCEIEDPVAPFVRQRRLDVLETSLNGFVRFRGREIAASIADSRSEPLPGL